MKKRLKKSGFVLLLVWGMMGVSLCAFEYGQSPENLKKLFETILKANARGDYATAAELTKSLMPDRKRAAAALRRDLPPGVRERIRLFHEKIVPAGLPDRVWAGLLARKPERSRVLVHGATTEEMVRNEKGSVVWREFPGGAVKMAGSVLRPGVRFYEVERVEPGRTRGYKYHLIFWDGKRWCMLGGIWRALPAKR